MSGHSKWSTIKRKKGALDAKRGAVFTKMAKLITVAAKQGGGDPEMNFKLRLAVDRARAVNMPANSIERAITKGSGAGNDGVVLEELVYEAYGPAGVAFIIEAVTDNKNRTTAEIKHILTDNGGRLGEVGSVAYMFEKKGVIRIKNVDIQDKDELEMLAIEVGAQDISEEEEFLVIETTPIDFKKAKEEIENNDIKIESAEIEMTPANPLEINDEQIIEKINKLMDLLDDQEDVNEIYNNLAD